MQGVKRRVVYVVLYEAIAIVVASLGLAWMSGASLAPAGALASLASVVAIVWNVVFNHVFEAWESRQAVRGRSIGRRVAHAVGFEGGLVLFLVPLFAWWLDVSLWHALVMDLGLVVFFLCYTFVFNWLFDHVFGLPVSASGVLEPAA
ncbi:MAG TPA: PACE efflux transporter [Burkholderiaceae bacterium]|nr:PACE efflux transporter [Burkholderiaceae bacterium]